MGGFGNFFGGNNNCGFNGCNDNKDCFGGCDSILWLLLILSCCGGCNICGILPWILILCCCCKPDGRSCN